MANYKTKIISNLRNTRPLSNNFGFYLISTVSQTFPSSVNKSQALLKWDSNQRPLRFDRAVSNHHGFIIVVLPWSYRQ